METVSATSIETMVKVSPPTYIKTMVKMSATSIKTMVKMTIEAIAMIYECMAIINETMMAVTIANIKEGNIKEEK